MQRPDGSLSILRLQLDNSHASKVGANPIDIASECRRNLRVRCPQRIFVGLAFIPESSTIELAIGRRKRGKIGISATLPVHVVEPLPFFDGDIDRHRREIDNPITIKSAHAVVIGVKRNLDAPMFTVGPEAHVTECMESWRTDGCTTASSATYQRSQSSSLEGE